jgi:hypothetical protein
MNLKEIGVNSSLISVVRMHSQLSGVDGTSTLLTES